MAEQPTMSTGEALGEIAKMKNIFRACERADEVLLFLQGAESHRDKLLSDIKVLEETAKKASVDTAATVAEYDAEQKQLYDVKKEFAAKLDAAQKKLDADMAAVGAQYSQMTVSAKEKMGEEIMAEQAKIDELIAKKGDLQRDVRMLEAEVETLNKRKAPAKAL